MAQFRIPMLHVGQGRRAEALTVFPVWVEGSGAHGLEWSADRLDIAELESGPSVSQLRATVRSSRPLVALEGDLLEGGMQDRMVAASMLLAPGSTGVLEARCVETGRWNGSGGHTARGRPRGLAARWDGILAAAALDARMAPSVPTLGQLAREFAAQMERMVLDVGEGAGVALRIRSTRRALTLSGIGVAIDPRRIIHATIWNTTHPIPMGA